MHGQFTFFVGTDVSKLTLNMSITSKGMEVHCTQIAHTKTGVATWSKMVSKQYGISAANTLFCMEFTGIYNYQIVECLHNLKASMWIMPGHN
jgi:hypothetical protein